MACQPVYHLGKGGGSFAERPARLGSNSVDECDFIVS